MDIKRDMDEFLELGCASAALAEYLLEDSYRRKNPAEIDTVLFATRIAEYGLERAGALVFAKWATESYEEGIVQAQKLLAALQEGRVPHLLVPQLRQLAKRA